MLRSVVVSRFLRISFSTATIVCASVAFLPLVATTAKADRFQPFCMGKPSSLQATYTSDKPSNNSTTSATYSPGCLYTNPPECLECHTLPLQSSGPFSESPFLVRAGVTDDCNRLDF